MLSDARHRLGGVRRTRVCVIGAGVAGIALALELERAGIDAVVLESGGFAADAGTRDLNRGETIGLPFAWQDGARSRYLGGSSNCWGGFCAPFHPHELAARPWVPDSGWPIGRADLDPYYIRAHATLGLGPFDYDVERWIASLVGPDIARYPGMRIRDSLAQFASPHRYGVAHREALRSARHVTVLLHANAVEIDHDPTTGSVSGVEVRTLDGGHGRIDADIVVLAAGGIENPRLLLASDRAVPGGIGNGRDLVGRYFADHPRVTTGEVVLRPDWRRNRLYDIKRHFRHRRMSVDGRFVAAHFMVDPAIQAEEGLTSALMWFTTRYVGEDTDAAEAIIRLKHRLNRKLDVRPQLGRDLATIGRHPADSAGFVVSRVAHPRPLERTVGVEIIAEPVPRHDSRVTLTDDRDRLGMRRVRVDWRLDDAVKRTIDRSLELLGDDLRASGVGELRSCDPVAQTGWPTRRASAADHLGTWHHMGTTRMHDDPACGVVDRDARVHGTRNLFVAGSSVFPTYGADFPTLTLAALAIRLADHVAEVLRPAELTTTSA